MLAVQFAFAAVLMGLALHRAVRWCTGWRALAMPHVIATAVLGAAAGVLLDDLAFVVMPEPPMVYLARVFCFILQLVGHAVLIRLLVRERAWGFRLTLAQTLWVALVLGGAFVVATFLTGENVLGAWLRAVPLVIAA